VRLPWERIPSNRYGLAAAAALAGVLATGCTAVQGNSNPEGTTSTTSVTVNPRASSPCLARHTYKKITASLKDGVITGACLTAEGTVERIFFEQKDSKTKYPNGFEPTCRDDETPGARYGNGENLSVGNSDVMGAVVAPNSPLCADKIISEEEVGAVITAWTTRVNDKK